MMANTYWSERQAGRQEGIILSMLIIPTPKLMPSELVLATCGEKVASLTWRLSQQECLAALCNPSILEQTQYYITFELQFSKGSPFQKIDLLFSDEAGYTADDKGTPGLWRIEMSIFDSGKPADDGSNIDDLLEESLTVYKRAVRSYTSSLGVKPDFDGTWDDPNYPDDQAAAKLAYWTLPEGRLQVQADYPDSESPVTVKIVSYSLTSVLAAV